MNTVLQFPAPEVPVEDINQDGGYIKLYRGFMDHPFYKINEIKAVFVHLLLLATSKPYKTMLGNQQVQLEPGQLICGTLELAEELGMGRQTVRTALDKLESEGMISRIGTKKGSIITVVKYSAYQGKNTQKSNHHLTNTFNHQSNHHLTRPEVAPREALSDNEAEQLTNTLTNTKPVELTTIQEYKNIKPNTSTDVDVSDSDESLLLQSAEEIAAPEKPAAKKTKPELPACPHDDILDAWAEIMPEKRQPKRNLWKHSSHADNLKHRWNQGFKIMHSSGTRTLYHDKESGIAFWRALFTMCSKSEFLMRDESSWFNMQWITKKSNFIKLLDRDFYQGGRHD